MKRCPYCGKQFGDDLILCPADQQPLIAEESKNTSDQILKEVGDYSADELKRFRGVFAADLRQSKAKEQRYAHPLLAVLLVGLAAIICASLLSQPPIAWLFDLGFFVFAAGMVAVVVVAYSLPKLKCPACHSFFSGELGRYCPECGSASLELKGWLNTPHCNSCKKDLRGGKGRNFKYKTCTHCGVFLDDKGL
jgi:hypothetical protein